MQRRYGNALSDGHSGNIRLVHIFRPVQNAAFLARQFNASRLAEAELFAVINHLVCAELHTQLHHAGVDGVFNNIFKGHLPAPFAVPVADNAVGNFYVALVLKHRLRRNDIFTQPHAAYNRFKNRTRLINNGNCPVRPGRNRVFAKIVRVKGRARSHAQYRAGVRVHQNGCRRARFGFLHGSVKRVLQHKLNFAVDGKVHRRHILRARMVHTRFAHRAAQCVHHFFLLCFGTFNYGIKRQLNTGEPLVIRAYKPQNLRGHALFGVITLAFFQKVQARQFVFLNYARYLVRLFRRQCTLNPYKTCFRSEIAVQAFGADAERPCQ